jgi:Zn-dependent protease
LFGLNTDDLLFRGIAFLIAITVHELAHAVVAYRLGDPTPQREGRLTLNPIAHLDLLGTLMILFGPIGWARPVTFNPYNFKGNKRLGKILTTLAGPLANLFTAVLFAFLFAIFFQYLTDVVWSDFVVRLVYAIIQLNVVLFIFNLVPIPPLDGYWIVRDVLPRKAAHQLNPVEKYGPFILLLFVVTPVSSWLLSPIMNSTLRLIYQMTGGVH